MTDEPASLVDPWVEANQPGYPIVILEQGSGFEEFLGVEYFPYAGVIDPDGKLAYAGSAGAVSGPLGKALKKADGGSLEPKVLDDVVEAYLAGDLAKSWAELTGVLEDADELDDGERARVEAWRSFLEDHANATLERLRAQAEGGRVYPVWEATEALGDSTLPIAEATRELRAQLEGHAAWKDEKKVEKLLQKADEAIAESEFEDAFEAYKKAKDRYGETRGAQFALARAKELLEKGRIGWDRNCMACKRGGERACNEHIEHPDLDG